MIQLILIGVAFLQIFAIQCQHNDDFFLGSNNSNVQEFLFQPKIIGGFPICLTHPDATYCEQDRSYPQFAIDYILKNSSFYNDPSIYLDHREKGFESRMINVTEEDNGTLSISTFAENALKSTCPFKDIVICPPVAKSIRFLTWVYIVNNPDFKQKIKGEKCDKGVNLNCDNNAPSSYESNCVQKFKRTTLLAIDPTTKKAYEDSFEMPSHCECETNSFTFRNFHTSQFERNETR